MDSNEFSRIRHSLGKTQKQLAQLLYVSPKAIQSFEQGWRHIPAQAEQQILLLLALKRSLDRNIRPCWEVLNCPNEWRENCIVWELQVRHFCWFIGGTFCQGEVHKNWEEKIQLCRKCKVFRSMIPVI